ncbi:hypothetical protein [Calidifontibacter terrae]
MGHPPYGPPQPAYNSSSSTLNGCLLAGMIVLDIAAAGVIFIFAGFSVMATDSCSSADLRTVCDDGRWSVGFPGLLIALAVIWLASLIGLVALRRSTSWLLGIGIGAAVLMVVASMVFGAYVGLY